MKLMVENLSDSLPGGLRRAGLEGELLSPCAKGRVLLSCLLRRGQELFLAFLKQEASF